MGVGVAWRRLHDDFVGAIFILFSVLFLHQFNLSSVQLGASAKTEGGHLHNEKGVLKNRDGQTTLHADVATLHCQFNFHFFTIN